MNNHKAQNFMSALKNGADSNNLVLTENGAVAHGTTGMKALDLLFSIPSYRGRSDSEIRSAIIDAWAENHDVAMRLLFFIRDARGGLGERRFFRVAFNGLVSSLSGVERKKVINLIPLIPEYGRWDDVIALANKGLEDVDDAVLKLVKTQLEADIDAIADGKDHISLLGKWMPSENTSSDETRRMAIWFKNNLGIFGKMSQYRKTLTKLRAKIKVVEAQMSANNWGDIAYPEVPSKANLIYKDAFLKHDTDRRKAFLEALSAGHEKINSSALFPYEIVSRYTHGTYTVDDTLEAMWKNLDKVPFKGRPCIVVSDGSGSMTRWGYAAKPTFTRATPMDVAMSIAIYFAERLPLPYKDRVITFSSRPQYVNLSGATTLQQKVSVLSRYNECSETNIEAVFDLILDTAIKSGLSSDDIPDVLIVSDMEFDEARGQRYWNKNVPLFENVSKRYEAAGFKLPRLTFWNVNSRTNGIPMTTNEKGVALISGFSKDIAEMVFSDETDPYKILTSKLYSKRYDPVGVF